MAGDQKELIKKRDMHGRKNKPKNVRHYDDKKKEDRKKDRRYQKRNLKNYS